jgi:Uma2 family endonuclease
VVVVAPLVWQPDRRTSLHPDLLVLAKDRTGEETITETPAIVVEVLSPSSSRYDRTMKRSRYAEAGIPQYWIVDPMALGDQRPSVEVYGLDNTGTYQLVARSEGDENISVTAPIPVTVAASALA